MCLFLSLTAALFAAYSRPARSGEFPSASESMAIAGAPAKAIIACTYLFVATFAATWGPVSWTYPPELFPLRVRGKAVALCTSANWAFNFALAYFVPPALVNIRWGTYVLFAGFCGVMGAHVWAMFPETANKTLEEVERIFEGEAERGEYPVVNWWRELMLTFWGGGQLSSILGRRRGGPRIPVARPWRARNR